MYTVRIASHATALRGMHLYALAGMRMLHRHGICIPKAVWVPRQFEAAQVARRALLFWSCNACGKKAASGGIDHVLSTACIHITLWMLRVVASDVDTKDTSAYC